MTIDSKAGRSCGRTLLVLLMLLFMIASAGCGGSNDAGSSDRTGNGAGFRAVSPRGDISENIKTLTWTDHPRAFSYRIEVFDIKMELAYQAVTNKTSLTLPDGARARELPKGMWRITPLDASGLPMDPIHANFTVSDS